MSKQDRARKRWRKAVKTPPPGCELQVKEKPKQPRDSAGRFNPDPEPRRTALDARCRQYGATPTDEARRALSAQHSGSEIGMVMTRECDSQREIARLWSVWQGFCTSERTYRTRILGDPGTPKGAAITPEPELTTDQHHTVDTRDPDEKDRDAVNRWMRWRGYLGHLDGRDATRLHDAELERGRPLWSDTRPTMTGYATLEALRRLADVVEGERR